MTHQESAAAHTPATPRLFWYLVGASVLLSLVPTLWSTLDLRAAGLFLTEPVRLQAGAWWWVEGINLYTPAAFRVLLVLASVGWLLLRSPRLRQWRFALAFVALAGAVGPGAVVNLVFKDTWQRARPYQVQAFGGSQEFTRAAVISDQCDANCSFVSGHVACGFFFASLMLIDAKRRRWWACGGVLAGLVIGFARMADGAHWLSDVLWACPVTLLSSWLVWRLLLRLYPPAGASPARTVA